MRLKESLCVSTKDCFTCSQLFDVLGLWIILLIQCFLLIARTLQAGLDCCACVSALRFLVPVQSKEFVIMYLLILVSEIVLVAFIS